MSEGGCWKYLPQEDLLHWLQFRPSAQLQNEENTSKIISYRRSCLWPTGELMLPLW